VNRIRVIWKSKTPNSNVGYLRYSFRINGKTVLKSVGVSGIEKNYFNLKTQRVRKTHPNHQYINEKIEETILEFKRKGQPSILNDSNKSFLVFFKNYITRILNQGTKNKYSNLYNLLNSFNKEFYNDVDIKFSDINVGFIENFKLWLRKTKKNSTNSTNYKLKSFKSILKKGCDECNYNYYIHPFKDIKLKFQDKKVEVLNESELKKIMDCKLKEVYRSDEKFGQIITNKKVLNDDRYKHKNSLGDIRNYFLFQLFCQGLRVSDLLTLRWNNFYIHKNGLRLNKKMIKTKHELDVFVNYKLVNLLINYIPKEIKSKNKNYDQIIQLINEIETLKSNNNFDYMYDQLGHSIYLTTIDPGVKKHTLPFRKEKKGYLISLREVQREKGLENLRISGKEIVKENFDNIEFLNIEESLKTEKLTYLEKLESEIERIYRTKKEDFEHKLNHLNLTLYNLFIKIIIQIKDDDTLINNFCFNLLKDEDFSDIDENNDFGLMSKIQYTKFSGSRTYYNRLLKVIGQQSNIKKKITSHTSRHTYTSLMLEIGEDLNLYDLMTSLGHKNLKTTQTYIKRFNNKKIDVLNRNLSDLLG